ncbi:MAG: hypothetical protein ACOCWT_00675 [Desulfohalobiaceae bacterium]
MRSYAIDELDPEDVRRFKSSLGRLGLAGPIEDIYWLMLPEELFTPEQREHAPGCGPYFLSLETGDTWLKLELLVRCRNRIRCQCIKYATPKQRAHAMDRLDELLRNRDIPV